MTTRSIITSQPDVACEVCERRLLRGEQPDIFLAAGHRRVVCELCSARAVQEGWRRESDGDALTLPPPRPRRGRNLFGRLRVPGRPAGSRTRAGDEDVAYASEQTSFEALQAPYETEPAPYESDAAPYETEPAPAETEDGRSKSEPPPSDEAAAPPARGSHPYDFLGGLEIVEGKPGEMPEPSLSPSSVRAGARALTGRAIEVFNSSEFPRRVAGIARSLGAPLVNVGPVEDTVGDTVAIIVGWELCWYRYEVDLDEEAPVARLKAQGTELDELPRAERVGNTPIDELGLLAPSAA
jgi:hypothetical protein